MLLEVMLHVGTLGAIVAYYRKEAWEVLRQAWSMVFRSGDSDPESHRLIVGIIVASVPTAVIGLLLEERVESIAESMLMVGACLMITGVILIAGEIGGSRAVERPGYPGWMRAFLIGVAQGLAVVPGISRSGATISLARGLGVPGPYAARFSFLMSIPAVGGAALLKVIKHRHDIAVMSGERLLAYGAGTVVAGVVGYLAILVVMKTIQRGRFVWFSGYCLAAGLAAVVGGLFFSE